ncbi:PIR protein [Plasmodium yoelii]|uniref:PIR protein n=2 Tax=Plasmodium yoelii TaxID=5861 RepID=A0AAE9WRD2_PLAYO|nr:PIR protein [Plasmodium yoelii]WBY57084.1 PIR protein [Plasmodium yoelii yoelii]CDU17784.1 YIR protein [Plasmodium yoelii]VTZ78201.1 PIR protein [Plasmodium yoelii]|eukprot:XP_022812091.1 PIR protein [Plasmodium yoelii]
MDDYMCGRFSTLRLFYPDELNKPSYSDFHSNGNIKDYCSDGDSGNTKECKTDFDKIKAVCLWLFEQLFVKNNNSNINTLEYIMIWLSYMLTLKKVKNINNLKGFYEAYIRNNTHYTNCNTGGKDCSNLLKDNTGYTNYKEIIDTKKDLLNINIENMSKFYDAFKLLCSIHTDFNEHKPNCTGYIEKSNEFVSKYTNLNDDSNNIDGSSYRKVLCTLSNDYDNFKKKCNSVNCMDIPSLPPIKKIQVSVNSPEQTLQDSGVTSSNPSILSKLIPVLSIIVAIPIFFGIFYKYSLFEFRKRPQKQHLREKLKK